MSAKVYKLPVEKPEEKKAGLPDDTLITLFKKEFGSLTRPEKSDLFFRHVDPVSEYFNPLGSTLTACRGDAEWFADAGKNSYEGGEKGRLNAIKGRVKKSQPWKGYCERHYRSFDGKTATFAADVMIKEMKRTNCEVRQRNSAAQEPYPFIPKRDTAAVYVLELRKTQK